MVESTVRGGATCDHRICLPDCCGVNEDHDFVEMFNSDLSTVVHYTVLIRMDKTDYKDS